MSAVIKKIDFQAPIRVMSEANLREHWAVKNKRKKDQQFEMMIALHNNLMGKQVQLPCKVKLTRIGPKALDTDNLAGAFKACRDQIAKKLGVDDGDTKNVTWEYFQMPVGIRQYSVKVTIESL